MEDKEFILTEEEKKLILKRREKDKRNKEDRDLWDQYDNCYGD
jgi:hypothetical protein